MTITAGVAAVAALVWLAFLRAPSATTDGARVDGNGSAGAPSDTTAPQPLRGVTGDAEQRNVPGERAEELRGDDAGMRAAGVAVDACITGRVVLDASITGTETLSVVALRDDRHVGAAPIAPDGAFRLRLPSREPVALRVRGRVGDLAALGEVVPRDCDAPEFVHADLSTEVAAVTLTVVGPEDDVLRDAWLVPAAAGEPTIPPLRAPESSTLDLRGMAGAPPAPWDAVLPHAGARVLVGAPGHLARELELTPADTVVRLERAPEVRVRLHYGTTPAWLSVRSVEFRVPGSDVLLCDPAVLDARGEATAGLEFAGTAVGIARAVVAHRDGSSFETTLHLQGPDGRLTFDLAEPPPVLDLAIGEDELGRLARLRGD